MAPQRSPQSPDNPHGERRAFCGPTSTLVLAPKACRGAVDIGGHLYYNAVSTSGFIIGIGGDMDDRVSSLKTDFPQIFEANRGLPNFENDWVVIDVENAGEPFVDGLTISDEFLHDLDRYEGDADELVGGFDTLPPSVGDVRLPAGVDVGLNDLVRVLTRPRPMVLDRVRRRIRGKFPGGPEGIGSGGIVPPPDALAVYLPFHRYPGLWGIYLLDAGVASLGRDLASIVRLLGHSLTTLDARRAAVTYLFHHEAYHSAVEAFALRSELPLRKPVYRAGLRRLYTGPWAHGQPHEETLATAYGILKVRAHLRLPAPILEAVILSLRIYMAFCSPPYSAADAYLDNDAFDDLERRFMEEAIRASTTKALPASAWTMGTYLMSPLLQRNRRYSWICDRADFYQRSRLAVHYFRRRDVVLCLQRLAGATTEPGGRHLHIVRPLVDPSGRPSSRRTQVSSGEVHRGTLAGMLKDLDIGLNVEGFRAECRKIGCSLS